MKSNADDIRRTMSAVFHHKWPRAHVVFEVGLVGGWRWLEGGPQQVIADAVIVDEKLRGFEFKSDSDNIDRLGHQIVAYSRIFDECSLVVGDHLFKKACALLPGWWGVWSASGERGGAINVCLEREPGPNPCIRPNDLATLLWRPELLKAMTQLGRRKGKASWTVEMLRRELVGAVDLDWVRDYVRRCWREREDWHIQTTRAARRSA